jgi:cyclic nucleotide-binding protein
MAINASIPLVASGPSGSSPAVQRRGLAGAIVRDASWVERLRVVARFVFPGVIVFCILVPWLAGRIFWTIAIAALPLFFVIAGYHRWRRICPLAAFAQLPVSFGRGGRHRMGRWMQAHAYHVSFGFLLTSLWLRLVATNGDGHALAIFLVGLSLTALATDSVFTGKTWCNYVCPISFVEKIYTEPRNLRPTANSQCQKCTACKPACPDINEENSYWKEVLLPAKRDVYFAFPGLVFAFYFFYYVQAGTWQYYFGGSWTNQIGLAASAFRPGVDATTAGTYFWPAVPRAIAAAVTLGLGAALSLVVFAAVERALGAWLIGTGRVDDQAGVRHVMFTVTAFSAFTTFYSFAGAPTLRLVPGLPHFFQLFVVTTATVFLVRRLRRHQTEFTEETLARQIIAKWPWKDTPAPHDLREAFLVHRIKSQSNEEARTRLLEMYKEAVRDTLQSGIVSRAEIQRLETIRDQMHISTADHERIMAELDEEERGVASALLVSPEKHLQLETYGQALAAQLARQRDSATPLDDAVVRALREEYAVTEEEHAAVLDRLVRQNEGLAAHFLDVPMAVEMACVALEHLATLTSPAARFLTFLLERRSQRMADALLRTVSPNPAEYASMREGLVSRDRAARSAALARIGARVSPAVAERMAAGPLAVRQEADSHPQLVYCLRRAGTSCPDPYVRSAALYLLESIDEATDEDYAALEHDEAAVVREIAVCGRRLLSGECNRLEPTTIAKMIGLKAIDLFDGLEPEDLAELAREGRESWFAPGDTLCREGEMGDEVFVLLDGEVSISRHDGGAERLVGVEGPGSVIGELAVLDPAPRRATVVAGDSGVRTLRLDGAAFRHSLTASPAVSEVIIRMLARRLRTQGSGTPSPAGPTLQRR